MHKPGAIKILARGMSGLGVAGAVLLAGTPVASADDVVGQTFSDAKAAIASRGGTVAVQSTVGDRQNLENCIVTSARKASSRDSSGKSTGDKKMMLALNCDSGYDGTHPGYSLGSVEGRILHQAQLEKAERLAAAQAAAEQEWAAQQELAAQQQLAEDAGQ